MNDVIVSVAKAMPIKHKFARFLISTIAGFAAQSLVERSYTSVYNSMKTKKFVAK